VRVRPARCYRRCEAEMVIPVRDHGVAVSDCHTAWLIQCTFEGRFAVPVRSSDHCSLENEKAVTVPRLM
jgi:hypothetical protein